MTITIHVPAALRACCEGASELFLSAPSVRAALEQLEGALLFITVDSAWDMNWVGEPPKPSDFLGGRKD